MRDPDPAWSMGSHEIEREANLDAMPPPNSYECYECERTCYFDEDGIGREVECDLEIHGQLFYGTGYLCPECAMIEMDLTPEDEPKGAQHDRNQAAP